MRELVEKFRREYESVEATEKLLAEQKAALDATKQTIIDRMEADGLDRTAKRS